MEYFLKCMFICIFFYLKRLISKEIHDDMQATLNEFAASYATCNGLINLREVTNELFYEKFSKYFI